MILSMDGVLILLSDDALRLVIVNPLEALFMSLTPLVKKFPYVCILFHLQPAHEKIGVVDSQWIIHQVIPSLGSQVINTFFFLLRNK